MARGNARELAREKAHKKQLEAQKKKSAAEKSSNKGLSLEERRRRDAEQIKLKQQKALEAKQSSAQSAWINKTNTFLKLYVDVWFTYDFQHADHPTLANNLQ